ncbi:ParB N-terminal domain-containing protein [Alicyclobacillus mali]|uniref:ParB N-terminal domain-containing protein n=1 Tax=Alicyclobacillus mali (ex Roth et al. 2021) TaxID=1123961 RepID=A0ABS0EZ86_9BACL|nr:ParB N-terminal domain-containing protein [Alicyclobacillus mali (ex Roth et al. 2021)]MBF8376354.1 ParB N-terminal domain-containing protein [Alicyclobacillus mali (ex Roth et al. 2021)]
MNLIHIDKLKPHPKNADYYADLTGEKYEELKRSIEVHGIRDPLKILPDGTILAGHQRYRIAKELGIEQVPVAIYDVSPEEAEYLLIADNEERRGVDEDPIRKAKRAAFLKEYWGVRRGGDRKSNHQIGDLKTAADVAEAVGVDAKHLNRLLKLNDLIPELQALVSSGKLGTSAAEQLAHLSPEIQRSLYEALGEEIANRTFAETKELRRRLEEAERRDQETARLQAELAELREQGREEDRQKIEHLERRIRDLQAQSWRVVTLEQELSALRERGRKEDRERIAELEREIEALKNRPVERVEVVPDSVQEEIEAWKRRAAELESKLKSTEELANQHAERVAKLFDEVVRLKSGGAVVEMPKRRDEEFNVSEWAKQYFRFMGDTSFLLKANPERMDALVEHLLQKRNTEILLLDLQMLERVAVFAEYMRKRLSERLHKPQLIKG